MASGKQQNVSLQPEEMAEEIYQCWKMGAVIACVRVRDKEDHAAMRYETFKKVVDFLHEGYPECDIIFRLITDCADDSEATGMPPIKNSEPEMNALTSGTVGWMHIGILSKYGDTDEKSDNAGGETAGCLKNNYPKVPLCFQFCMKCDNDGLMSNESLFFMKHTLTNVVPKSLWHSFCVGKDVMEAFTAGSNLQADMDLHTINRKEQLLESNKLLITRARQTIAAFSYEMVTSAESCAILGVN